MHSYIAFCTQNENVIIDRCNFNKSQRRTWIEIAWKFDAHVDAIVMDVPYEVSFMSVFYSY